MTYVTTFLRTCPVTCPCALWLLASKHLLALELALALALELARCEHPFTVLDQQITRLILNQFHSKFTIVQH